MSIISGAFVAAATAVTIASLVAGVLAAGGLDRRLLVRAAAAVSLLVPTALYVALTDPFHSSIPWSFYVWIAVPLLGLGITVTAWPRVRLLARFVSIAPILTGVLFAGANINAHYAYYPTLASLTGQRAHDQVSSATLARVEASTTDAIPRHGMVVAVDIPGVRSGFHARQAVVYLPPAWQRWPRPKLPVVLLLAGTPGTPWDWTRAGYADLIADEFAAGHEGLAPILVVADANGSWLGDTECVDGPRGNAETYLTEDVRHFVIDRFNAAAAGEQWAVGGLSEGGTCSLVLALRHPRLFTSFIDLSGGPGPATTGDTVKELFGGSAAQAAQHDPRTLLVEHRYPALAGWFESGTNDAIAHDATARIAPALTGDGATVCVVERSGAHNFLFWRSAFRHALRWVAARQGLIAEPPAAACAAAEGNQRSSVQVALTGG